ncbi:MAG: MFS transporter [Chloroflexi bacterium]|nr:MFS transporter [Chloroflexota bacterium]MBI2979383.1 MFS transporter [Chloroflexota bacterium]
MTSRFSWNFVGRFNSADENEPYYYGWVVVVALLVIGVVSFGVSLSFGVFFKPLLEGFDLTRTLTAGIYSAYILLGSLFGVFSGWALDRYGARMIVMLTGCFTGLSLIMTSRASAPWHLLVTYSLLLAIGVGPVYTIMMSAVSRWFTRRRVLAVGIVGSGMGIGPMLMAPLAAWLIARYDWRISFLVIGIIALVTIVPCALLLKKAPIEVPVVTPEQPNNSIQGEFSIQEAARTRNFWLLFAIWFFLACSLSLIMTHIVPYAIDSGVTPTRAAFILSLASGISVLGRLLVGKVSDNIGRKPAAVGSVLLVAGAMVFLVRPLPPSNLLGLYLFAVIFGLFSGGIDPPIVAQFGDIFGLRHIGVIIGVLNLGWGAGAALGSALGGYIFDISGSYIPAFLFVLVVLLMTAGLILLLRMPATGWDRQRGAASPSA